MIPAQNSKHVTLYDGTLATNNTTVYSAAMSGYRSARIVVQWDKASATNSSVTLTTCDFKYGDTTSSFTTISGGNGTSGTASSSQYTLPVNNSTSLYSTIVADVRNDTGYAYIGALVAPSSTSFKTVTITAHLSEPTEGPVSNGGGLKGISLIA